MQEMTLERTERVYGSGEVVEPGVYVDVETGSVVRVNEPDELPAGSRTIRYERHFRRISGQRSRAGK